MTFISKIPSVFTPRIANKTDDEKKSFLDKTQQSSSAGLPPPAVIKGTRSTLFAALHLKGPNQLLEQARKSIHNTKGLSPEEHSANVKEQLGNLMGTGGIQYRTDSMANASSQKMDANFHYSQEEKQLRSFQNEALKVIEKGFSQMTPKDRIDFLEKQLRIVVTFPNAGISLARMKTSKLRIRAAE